MDIAEGKIFYGGKELLDACIEKVSEGQNGLVGGNVALYPTIIVMLGEKCKQYTKHIKNTLDDNWNNSRFLKYVCFEKVDNNWNGYILTNNEKRKEIEWKQEKGTIKDIFTNAIVEMLGQQDKIFRDKNTIKMEFIMETTEEEGKAYFELYREIGHGLQNKNLKTLYLMVKQETDEERQKSEIIWRYILEKQKSSEKTGGTIYVLSNYLKSGGFLLQNEIWKNYRLVADIILLGGNRGSEVKEDDEEQKYVSNLYNGIKTASYFLLEKPTDEIVFSSLYSLLKYMKKREEEHFMTEISEQVIKDRLGIIGTGEFLTAEEIFKEKILKKLPHANDLQYLPICSEKRFKELQKMARVTEKAADDCTLGVWSLFVQEKYVSRVKQYLSNDEEQQELAKQIRNMLYTSFSFFEILKMISKKELLIQMLKEDLKSKGVKDNTDYKQQLQEKAVFECKKEFYKSVKEILINEFEIMLDMAEDYSELYEVCLRELSQEKIILSDENVSIEGLYAEEARKYVEKHQKINTTQSAFPKVFDIRLKKEGLLSEFWKVFMDLVQEEVYEYDFEKELNFRMGNMTEERRQVYVRDKLQTNLEGSVRLNSLTTVWTKSCRFYLVNNRADYAKHLAKLEGNRRDFMLFNLNRTDCIEQIEIYNIINPERIFLKNGEI